MATVEIILKGKGAGAYTIGRDATVYDAIARMAERNVGSLVVTDGDAVLGIVTERDYLRDVALRGRSSRSTSVGEIMSSPVVSAGPADTIQQCMEVMSTHRFRHLPVIEDGRLAGVVSMGDLVNHLLTLQSEEIHELQAYIQGRY